MFFQVHYQETHPIIMIRDYADLSQCWFRASDIADFMDFISPKLAAINIIYRFYPNFKDYIKILSINTPDYDKNGAIIYLNPDGVALFFLLAGFPNWEFIDWVKGVVEYRNNNGSQLSQIIK